MSLKMFLDALKVLVVWGFWGGIYLIPSIILVFCGIIIINNHQNNIKIIKNKK